MKRSLIALAVLAASGAAMAQSSVTLFGIVDATVRTIDAGTGGSIWQLTNSGMTGSRLGFRGTEDLGGGLNASFWLEAGMNNDNGTGSIGNTNNAVAGSGCTVTGAMPAVAGGTVTCAQSPGSQGLTFNRRSTVSLASTWGELRLGRDTVPTYPSIVIFDPFTSQGVGTPALFALAGLNLLTGGALNINTGAIRASNSISYFMPNIAGFYGNAMYAMGEGVDTSPISNPNKSNGNVGGVRVGYANGPANIAFAWSATTFRPSEQYQAMNLGASWNFGMIMPRFLWNQEKALNTTANSYMLGATAPIGAGEVKAAYTWGSSSDDRLDGSMISLGYVYNLSRRTALYTTGSYISNSGTKATYNYSLAGTPVVPPVGGNTWGLDFGVKHSF